MSSFWLYSHFPLYACDLGMGLTPSATYMHKLTHIYIYLYFVTKSIQIYTVGRFFNLDSQT